MYEVVSGHFYLPMWAENAFYGTKNVALCDRIGFKKNQDGIFEQIRGQTFTNFVNF